LLDPRQMLFLDGLRYSVEMAHLAHTRLRETLYGLTVHRETLEPETLSFSAAFLDAWSIVDSINRLRCLLHQAPGIKQRSPGLRIFRQKTEVVEDLRNTIQHLDQNVPTLLAEKLPVLGVLSWFVTTDPGHLSGFSCALTAGTLRPLKQLPLVNPCGRLIAPPIDLIELTAGGHSACLSDIMKHVQDLTRQAEQQLEKQFDRLPQAGADLFVCVEMAFGGPTSRHPGESSSPEP
ncbi:unnamed protein product, partial [marine sediment metagenome]